MLIHLIRHTTPDIKPGICYGQADLDLASTFEQEKDSVLDLLLPQYEALYTSPLSRCHRLAKHIKANNMIISDDIMEYNFGDWELKTWDELREQDSQAWFDDYVNVPAPNGESFRGMQQRVVRFIENLVQQDHESVAVITHSGVQRLVWAWLLDIPLDKIFRLDIQYGDIFELNYDQHQQSGKIRRLPDSNLK